MLQTYIKLESLGFLLAISVVAISTDDLSHDYHEILLRGAKCARYIVPSIVT